MARKRMIDPEFWSDEEIGSWSYQSRLFYIGLWNFADDEGRFKAHNDLLRSQIFPYDKKINIDKLKNELGNKIHWYEINGAKYGYIRNFAKHQRIDRPTESKLPPPTIFDEYSTSIRGDVLPNLKEDNISKDNIREEKQNDETSSIVNVWNDFAKENNLTTIIKLTDKREKSVKTRISEKDFDLQKILEKIKNSPFLLGKNDKGWKVDFDFVFCSANNYLKILEGKYDGKSNEPRRKDYVTKEEYESELRSFYQ